MWVEIEALDRAVWVPFCLLEGAAKIAQYGGKDLSVRVTSRPNDVAVTADI